MIAARYDLDLVLHGPEGSRIHARRLGTGEVMSHLARLQLEGHAFVRLREHDAGFLLWWGDERARVRVDGERDWYASGTRTPEDPAQPLVAFTDVGGAPFVLPWAATLSRDEAHEALVYWLGCEERTPRLHWS